MLHLLGNAMGSCQDVDAIDQRSAAKLASIVEESRYPGPLVRVRIVTSDDSFRVLWWVILEDL